MRWKGGGRPRLVTAVAAVWVPAGVLLVTGMPWGVTEHTVTLMFGDFVERPPGWYVTAGQLWWTLFAIAEVAGVTAVAVALVHHRAPATCRTLLGVAGGAGGFCAAVGWVYAVGLSLVAGVPALSITLDERLLWALPGLAWAIVPYLLVGRVRVKAPGTADPVDGVDLAPGERAAWTTTLRSWSLIAASLVALGVVALAAVTSDPWTWLASTAVLAALAVFAEVRVTVDRRGLRLVAGWLRLPFKRIPLADITSASATAVDPKKWGGWGYRVMPGRSALVLRKGPGLVLTLTDGRAFAVTVNDPETPAALLSTLTGARDKRNS